MKTVSVIVGVLLSVSSVVWAAPGEEALNWTTDDYEAIPFTLTDGVTLAAIATAHGFLNNQMAQAFPITAFLGWGAWRTRQYRSEVNRATVTENIKENAAKPKPGTVQHTLECDATC